jgi:hypothetical protein
MDAGVWSRVKNRLPELLLSRTDFGCSKNIVLFVLLAFSVLHILSSQIISLRPLRQCDGFANSLRLPPSRYFRALSSYLRLSVLRHQFDDFVQAGISTGRVLAPGNQPITPTIPGGGGSGILAAARLGGEHHTPRAQRESPPFLEFPDAKNPQESVFEATARVSSNQPCCTPLHQELAGTSHPQTIDLCTNDSLEIGLVESQECISLSPESRKKDRPILGLGKHEHFVEGEFDGHQN